ncbi:MAG: hypothetical protein AAGB46_15800 [Verrucomicrobiota bacterium]
MKFSLLLGGLLGFVTVYAIAFSVGKSPMTALFQASVGSIGAGLLFRWVGLIWIRNVKQMLMEKQQAAIAAMAEAEERKHKDATKESVAKPV